MLVLYYRSRTGVFILNSTTSTTDGREDSLHCCLSSGALHCDKSWENLSFSPKFWEKLCIFLKMSNFFSTWANNSPMLRKKVLILRKIHNFSHNFGEKVRFFLIIFVSACTWFVGGVTVATGRWSLEVYIEWLALCCQQSIVVQDAAICFLHGPHTKCSPRCSNMFSARP